MRWICLDCNWTGSAEEFDRDVFGFIMCPVCDGANVDIDDREPDPLTEQTSEGVSK